MKLSVSNIGWSAEDDEAVYTLMMKYGFCGLEIAPTRIFPENPYDKLKEALEWSRTLKEKYGFTVSSMQSIWYGRQEKLFGTEEERQSLLEYTKKAIDFAAVMNCRNLVFGCPKSRNVPDGMSQAQVQKIVGPFFKELGDYAASKGTVLAMEANPPVYHTNYINDTGAALELIRQVDSPGFLLNLDAGTMIENGEEAAELAGKVHLINHVHISEPGLKPVCERTLHGELLNILKKEGYKNYISVEMGKQENICILEGVLKYVGNLMLQIG